MNTQAATKRVPVIYTRKLIRKDGAEGPAHDPYSYTRYTVQINKLSVTLHCGLGVRLFINDREVMRQGATDKEKVAAFELATGIDLRKFDKYYDRVHPYFEDPMGHPSQYI